MSKCQTGLQCVSMAALVSASGTLICFPLVGRRVLVSTLSPIVFTVLNIKKMKEKADLVEYSGPQLTPCLICEFRELR